MTSIHWFQKQIDRTLADLATVLNSFFDGMPEVDADKDSRQTVFVGRLGERVEVTEHR
jgi:hypothetical protein